MLSLGEWQLVEKGRENAGPRLSLWPVHASRSLLPFFCQRSCDSRCRYSLFVSKILWFPSGSLLYRAFLDFRAGWACVGRRVRLLRRRFAISQPRTGALLRGSFVAFFFPSCIARSTATSFSDEALSPSLSLSLSLRHPRDNGSLTCLHLPFSRLQEGRKELFRLLRRRDRARRVVECL